MKLLVDNQLPPALARYLQSERFDCVHVRDIGLASATDHVIWEYAKTNHQAIVTMDQDFYNLAIRGENVPPQIVWVRLGNCRKTALLKAFATVLPALRELLDAGNAVMEIR